uniref:Lipoprotein n=1 Tax=uncultured Alphaproteobacteria bacterium TaxID=91750 RepID=A0A6G8F3C2_9PROT|nr:hypothetical protein PlAlph_5840 [uncultured Alphaproteobacteria bacterium]
MKKFMTVLSAVMFLAACENVDMTKYTTASADDSIKTRLRACMLNEATERLKAGTLLANGLSAAADDISNTCIKKLALQAAGIDTEAASTATSILNSLLGSTAAQ